MTGCDRISCDYPLPDPRDQDRAFFTADFGGFGHDRYVITADGRLIRQARPDRGDLDPVRDVEWPIHGDIRIFDDDSSASDDPVEYAVRFTHGRVEWIRRVHIERPPVLPTPSALRDPAAPDAMGRPASPEEFSAAIPEKLELVDGHIPGEEKLVMFLLSTMGLRRVAALVGRRAWMRAVEDQV
jgi:hypothetical protein